MLMEDNGNDDLFLQDLVCCEAAYFRGEYDKHGRRIKFKYVLRETLVIIEATCTSLMHYHEGFDVEYTIFDTKGNELPALYQILSDEEDDAIKYTALLEFGIDIDSCYN